MFDAFSNRLYKSLEVLNARLGFNESQSKEIKAFLMKNDFKVSINLNGDSKVGLRKQKLM